MRSARVSPAAAFSTKCPTPRYVALESLLLRPGRVLPPIDFDVWVSFSYVLRALEPQRPGRSDPRAATALSAWWFDYAVFLRPAVDLPGARVTVCDSSTRSGRGG